MFGIRLNHISRKGFATSRRVTPRVTQLLIDGKFVNSASGDTFETINPVNEQPITTIQRAGKEDVDRAIEAARRAFDKGPWRKYSDQQRADCLFNLARLVQENAEELAMLEALDNGKPVEVAKVADLPMTIDCYRYFAGWADKITGDTIPVHGNFFAYTRREPVGVAAQIIPWNVPLLMQAYKLGPAMATGCTVVMKSAEQTPLTALRVGELIKEAGFPDGVVNILSGYGEDVGAYLAQHPGVDKVGFTGSSEVGLQLMKNSSVHNLKRMNLELGGKSPNIIWEDADIGMAIQQAHMGVFFNMGQVCIAGSRVFVHEKIYDEFVEKSVKCAEKAVLGDSLDPNTTQGPQVSKVQFERVLKYIESGTKQGAKLLTGGQRHGDKGYFIKPTVFADVSDDMTIAKEEIFGPVMPILKFSDYDEVIERANNTSYGLGAGIVTKDLERAIHLTNSIRAGTVFVNWYDVFRSNLPFGGFKNSGLGREQGSKGLNNYLEDKTVVIARPEGSIP